MQHSTLPLFPSDEGWPYPDVDPIARWGVEAEIDLDELELRADPHAYDGLTALEHAALFRHFGLDHRPAVPMKQLGAELGCSRAEAREALGAAIAKVRTRLEAV